MDAERLYPLDCPECGAKNYIDARFGGESHICKECGKSVKITEDWKKNAQAFLIVSGGVK